MNGPGTIGQYFSPGSSAAMADGPSRKPSRPRNRQRAQLSCDRCRRLKRKCNRESPCSECTSIGSQCTFERAKETTEAVKVSRERRRAARRRSAWPDTPFARSENDSAHRSPAEMSNSSESADRTAPSSSSNVTPASGSSVTASTTPEETDLCSSITTASSQRSQSKPLSAESVVGAERQTPEADIEGLVREPAFLDRILAIWFREIDWAHNIIRNTPFDRTMIANPELVNSQEHMDKYGGLLYAIVAMTALVVPSDVEAVLVGICSAKARHGFYSGDGVGKAAHARAEEWMTEKARTSDVETWNSEVFQTALVHGSYIKYTGNWNLYREASSRDMDRLQRARYNHLIDMVHSGLEDEEIASRYNVFWRFFTFDRISSLFDGVPYRIQARNADTWLFIRGLAPVHIRALCQDSGAGPLRGEATTEVPDLSPRLVEQLENRMSNYSRVMVQLAALAGRCGDRLNSMGQGSLADNYVRAEHIAAETDDDLLSLEATIPMNALEPQEHPMVTLTIARIRRDVTTRLSRHIAKQHRSAPGGEDAMVQTLNRRCLNTAKSLIRRATSVCGFTAVRAIAMPFFTLFVTETMVELLTSVEEYAMHSTPCGSLDSESKDDLKHALIGRNFLVLLSRLSEMQLNKMVTHKACSHVSAVLQACLPLQHSRLHQAIININTITDPDPIISSIPSPPQPLETECSPQRAEDVLDFLGSLTSLQRTFEMGGQSWSE